MKFRVQAHFINQGQIEWDADFESYDEAYECIREYLSDGMVEDADNKRIIYFNKDQLTAILCNEFTQDLMAKYEKVEQQL